MVQETFDAANLTDEQRTTAIGLARYAFDYIEAARLVDHHEAGRSPSAMISPIPAYFLAVHGVELTLKAFLRYQGLSVRELSSKKYGHDLHACYRKAKELGLTDWFVEDTRDVDVIHMLVELNKGHGLRYVQTGWKRFPYWALVDPFMVRLHQAVAPLVGYNKTFTVHFDSYAR